MSLILIIEDEPDLVANLEYNLRREGYQTQSALTAQSAFDSVRHDPLPDLILLDLMLPDLVGTEVCRQLRSQERTKHIPILMLTAKGEEIDRVVGFEVGADDYMAKPFSVRELLLRIRAIIRRSQPTVAQTTDISFGILRVDNAGHRVWVESDEVLLTALEFRLLITLLNRRGRVQTRDMLLSDVWGIDADVTTRTVDTHVKRLRQKLNRAGAYVETLRGVGYRIRASPDESSC
ncbi:MAG: response regulator transcription factor [Myxococcota bacterium]